jgi:hypothetical protein
MVAVTWAASGSGARVCWPWKRVKWPRILLTIRWRTVKATSSGRVDGVGPGDVAGDHNGSGRHD